MCVSFAAQAEISILHFGAILLCMLNCFFTLSRHFFQQIRRLLEEQVKILKVCLKISACRVACREVDWY